MSISTKYDRLLAEIQDANQLYVAKNASSPTISELSMITGVSEEHILESMEFGQKYPEYVC
ncbi:MAG TPA: hypothetical protein VFK44_09045 [Bacillales bacterium]|nr:hypothetical protein [Bacillales bacterium]